MSKLGTLILALCVLATGLVAAYAGLNAGSQPFAIHMAIMALACVIFLLFILRRAAGASAEES